MMATEPQLPLDDALLGKFLASEASPAEAEQVRRWLADPANQHEFERFVRIWNAAKPSGRPNEIDTDAAWQRVRSQMSRPTPSADAPTVRPLPVTPRPTNWFGYGRVAATLLIVLFAGIALWQITRSDDAVQTPTLLSATTTTTKRVRLPDGSQVLLNRNSRLTYPASFADSSRNVTLTGEAFFEVTHDPVHPFRVKAGTALVRVLGTSFNVKAVGDSVRVAVRTGRVQLSAGRQAVVLTPDQQATYLAKADTIRRAAVFNSNQLAYQTGRLSFVNASLAEVVQTLREVYGTDIRLANTAVGRCRLTADFGREPIDAVLVVVAETLSLSVKREGNGWLLTGSGCGL